MRASKRFVYVLKSATDPARYYTGLTSNVRARVAAHNDGHCAHTATGRPWRAIVVIAFAAEDRAIQFEQYLKSGSGVASKSLIHEPERAGISSEVPLREHRGTDTGA
jgi:putative endonuclease